MLRYVPMRIGRSRASLLVTKNLSWVSSIARSEQQRHASSLQSSASSFAVDSHSIQNYNDPSSPILSNCSIDVNSETYSQAMERTRKQVEELNQRIEEVSRGGGPRAVEKHLNRNKLLPRDRMQVLCDPGTPFLELSALAGNMDGIPSGGIVTGIGMVSGSQRTNSC